MSIGSGTEQFPHLSNAPIVEAVLDLKASFKEPWDPNALRVILKEILVEYPKCEEKKKRVIEAKFNQQPDQLPQMKVSDLGCQGFIFRNHDGCNVA